MAESDIAVRVGADITPLTVGLRKANSKLKTFGASAEKLTQKILPIAAATVAVTGAIGAMAIAAAEAEKEWKNLATIAGSSINKFKAAAFATETVGISAEKLADISKDTREKLGEFIATGGGGFKDFFELVAPKIGMTAKELQHLSGPQVLQKVKDAMDEANVPMEKQSFFLESIASDTTNLIPLLENHGAKLNALTDKYNDFNGALELTKQQRKNLDELSISFDLLGKTASNAGAFIVSKLGPQLSEAFDDMAAQMSEAAEALGFFIDTFDENSVAAMTEKLLENTEQLDKLAGQLKFMASDASYRKKLEADQLALEAENKTLLENIRLKGIAEDQEKAATPDLGFTPTGGDTSGTVAGDDAAKKAAEDEARRLAAQQTKLDNLQDGFKTELELLQQKYAAEQALLDQALLDNQLSTEAHNSNTESLAQQHQDNLLRIEKAAAAARLNIATGMLDNISSLMSSGSKKQFEIGKKASIAAAVIKGYEAITSSYAAGAKIGGPVLGGAFAATAAVATANQIANIRKTSFSGGGSVSTSGASSGAISPDAGGGGSAEPSQTQNISITGLNPGELVQSDVIIDIINNATEKGALINLGTPA